jgi:alpha-glucosidase (family GH31 glycosyl hydrolase)
LLHHPDALFPDAPAKVLLDREPYQPLPGPLTVAERSPNGVVLAAADGARLAITCCADGLWRLRAGATLPATTTERLGLVQVPADAVTVTVQQTGNVLTLAGGGFTCRVDLADAEFAVVDARGEVVLASVGGGFRFSPGPAEYSGQKFFAAFRLDPQERLFGFGGRIMRPDRTGMFADMFAVKAGLYSGDYGGFPVPFFLSTRGYGVFVNNPWPHLFFDLGRTDPAEWFVHGPGGECDVFLLAGPEFADLLGRFTRLVGRLPAPRRWWLGFWAGSLSITTAAGVLDAARRFRAAGLPVDAIQIDGNWRGGPEFFQRYMLDGAYTSNDFDWHPAFGDGRAMVEELRALGIRTVLHVNSRPFSEATTARGVAEGWLRKQGHETVVRVGDPAAEAKYRELIAARNAERIGCWLQDHGDRVSGEVLPGVPSRNLFGALWARATTVTGSDTGDPARVVFTRGAGIGGQRHCIVWSGDTQVGMDFCEEDIWYLINAGLAGYPLASCDLGGYMFAHKNAAPHNLAFDPDNLARRLCQSLFFMPTPRTQDDGRDPPKFPWNCPPPIEKLYGDMLRLRYRMIPYHYSYLVHAARTGEPLVRPLVYHHRQERECWTIHDQFYLGEWLLVAPIVKKSAEHRLVYLPAGRWFNFWTDEEHTGPKAVLVPCPLYEPQGLPVFVKAGAILPTQADVDRLTDDPPAELWLDIYPNGESTFVLNDGMELTSRITCRQKAGRVEVEIADALPFERRYHVRLHGVPATTKLTVHIR